MTTSRTAPPRFDALELSLELIRGLRRPVALIRRRNGRLASQLEDAASSVAANVSEGNRRSGKDRLHLFRIAAGSAEETRTHLRVAEAWGYVTVRDIEPTLALADRQLAVLWRLTH